MPLDISSGTNAAMRGAGMLGDVAFTNRRRQDAMTDRLADTAEAAGARSFDMAQKRAEREKGLLALKSWGKQFGIDENDPAWQHPETAMLRIEAAQKEASSRTEYEREVGRDETRFNQQKTLAEIGHGYRRDERAEDRGFALADEGRADAREGAERERTSGFLADLLSPVSKHPGVPYHPDMRTTRPPTEADLAERFRTADPAARDVGTFNRARGFLPKPVAAPKWDDTPEGYRTRKEIDAEFDKPTPRNIDPLSPEGIEAYIDRKTQEEAIGGGAAGKMTDQQRHRALFIRQRLGAIGKQLELGEGDATKLQEEAAALQAEHDRIAPPVSGESAAPAQGAAHPSGLPADKARKLEANGFRWDGQGWVK